MPSYVTFFLVTLVTYITIPACAQNIQRQPVEVPSEQKIFWQNVTVEASGDDLIYNFRFVAPALAYLVPGESSEAMAALIDQEGLIADNEPIPATAGKQTTTISIQPATRSDIGSVPPGAPEDGSTIGNTAILQPLPDNLLRDPMHDDIVWLCEKFVLPRIAPPPAPRPTKIVIAMSDRPFQNNEPVLGAVQLFQFFSLPPNRNECVWNPI